MAWTTPKTFVVGSVLPAADLNTHLRDNLKETAPAKVTTAGDTIYATGANAIERRAKGTAGQIDRQGVTNPEWANLSASGSNSAATIAWVAQNNWDDMLTVDLTPGVSYGKVLIWAGARIETASAVTLRVGNGTSWGQNTGMGGGATQYSNVTCSAVIANAAASTTFKLQAYTGMGGAGTLLSDAWIVAIWLPS